VVAALRERQPDGPLVHVGFSQGVATAFRAAARGRHRSDAVIALGGELPPDVVEDASVTLPRVLLGRGSRDEYYAEARFAADVAWLDARGWLAAGHAFEGGHEFGETFRAAAGALLARLAMTGARA
jgi:predicted esterase